MRILLIGQRSHQFIYNYVRHLKKEDSSIVVDILSYETKKIEYPNDYLFDHIFILKTPQFIASNKYLNYIYRYFKFRNVISHMNNYDYIHLHFIENVIKDNIKLLKHKFNGKLISTIWGSDFYKRTDIQKNKMLPLFKSSHKITFTNREFAKQFLEYYNDNELKDKVYRFVFGLEPLEFLDNVEKAKDSFINVTVGYNARHNQCHLEILDNIIPCLKEMNNVRLLVPLTYPNDDKEYIQTIEQKLKESRIPYITYKNFMSDNDVAQLRKNTDVLIQLQKTDVLSGSMMEHLAAGSIVITGSWLPYQELIELGIKMIMVDSRSETASILKDIINNLEKFKKDSTSNASRIISNYKWSLLIKECKGVYDN